MTVAIAPRCGRDWRRRSCFAWAAAALAIAGGCSPPSGDVEVTGTVILHGEPLPGGSATFFPANGRPATASIDATGKYELRLVPGDYQVTVAADANVPEGWQEGDPLPSPLVELPHRYTVRQTTPLKVQIVVGMTGPADLQID